MDRGCEAGGVSFHVNNGNTPAERAGRKDTPPMLKVPEHETEDKVFSNEK